MAEKKQTKGAETRDRVIKCASELMARKGVGAASLSDIASAAGIRKPSLYNHFESRDELEECVFSYIEGYLAKASFLPADIQAVVNSYSAAAVLKALLVRYVKAFIVPPALYAYTVIQSEKYFSSRVASIEEARHEKLEGEVRQLLTTMCEAGKLSCADIDLAAGTMTLELEKKLSDSVISGQADEEDLAVLAERYSLLYAVC